MFNEVVLKYFTDMENVGRVKNSNAVGKAKHENGDMINLYLKVEETGNIKDASFKAFGSVGIIATGALLSTLLKDKHIKSAVEITEEDLASVFGEDFGERRYVLTLALEALSLAIKNYYEKLEAGDVE